MSADLVSISEDFIPVSSLHAVLDELKLLLLDMDDISYSGNISVIFSGTIGSHVRHILDHVRIFIDGIQNDGVISYDDRERGVPLEKDRKRAIKEIEHLSESLRKISCKMETFVRVTVMHSPVQPPAEFASTAGREIAFLISHSIHHHAVISGILKEIGKSSPVNFGFAPSTISYNSGLKRS